MKTSVISTLIESIARVQDFIPEKDMLVERTVRNILDTLRKQSNAVRKFTTEEKAVAIHAGVDIRATETLLHSPETKELLTKVGEAVFDYYSHVDEIVKIAEVDGEPN